MLEELFFIPVNPYPPLEDLDATVWGALRREVGVVTTGNKSLRTSFLFLSLHSWWQDGISKETISLSCLCKAPNCSHSVRVGILLTVCRTTNREQHIHCVTISTLYPILDKRFSLCPVCVTLRGPHQPGNAFDLGKYSLS